MRSGRARRRPHAGGADWPPLSWARSPRCDQVRPDGSPRGHGPERALGALAILVASRYLRQHGGWDLESGSNDLMTIMLLVLGFVLALSVAALQPGARNVNGTRLTSVIWTVALLAALLFTWRVIVVSPLGRDVGTIVTSPQEFDAFVPRIRTRSPPTTTRYRPASFCSRSSFSTATTSRTGFVWQLYGPEIPDQIMRGVVFPEAVQGGARPKRPGGSSRKTARNRSAGTSAARFGRTSTIACIPFDRQDIWLHLVSGASRGRHARCPISMPTAT